MSNHWRQTHVDQTVEHVHWHGQQHPADAQGDAFMNGLSSSGGSSFTASPPFEPCTSSVSSWSNGHHYPANWYGAPPSSASPITYAAPIIKSASPGPSKYFSVDTYPDSALHHQHHHHQRYAGAFLAPALHNLQFTSSFNELNGTSTAWIHPGSRTAMQTRVQMACTLCRGRKAKCDGAKSGCGRCTKQGKVCVYEKVSKEANEKLREKKQEAKARKEKEKALENKGFRPRDVVRASHPYARTAGHGADQRHTSRDEGHRVGGSCGASGSFGYHVRGDDRAVNLGASAPPLPQVADVVGGHSVISALLARVRGEEVNGLGSAVTARQIEHEPSTAFANTRVPAYDATPRDKGNASLGFIDTTDPNLVRPRVDIDAIPSLHTFSDPPSSDMEFFSSSAPSQASFPQEISRAEWGQNNRSSSFRSTPTLLTPNSIDATLTPLVGGSNSPTPFEEKLAYSPRMNGHFTAATFEWQSTASDSAAKPWPTAAALLDAMEYHA